MVLSRMSQWFPNSHHVRILDSRHLAYRSNAGIGFRRANLGDDCNLPAFDSLSSQIYQSSFLSPHIWSIKPNPNLNFSDSLFQPSQATVQLSQASQRPRTSKIKKSPITFTFHLWQSFPKKKNTYQQKWSSPLCLPLSPPSPFLPAQSLHQSPLRAKPLLSTPLQSKLQSTPMAFQRSWFLEPLMSLGLRRGKVIPAYMPAKILTLPDIALTLLRLFTIAVCGCIFLEFGVVICWSAC